MSHQSEVICSVGTTGVVTIIDVKPAPGKNCREITAELESRLGIVDEASREITSNAYVQNDPLRLNVKEG